MSHGRFAALDVVAGASCHEGDIIFCRQNGSVSELSAMESKYLPLAARNALDLRARADELRRMAGTARTSDVARSLRVLADRYDDLADQRQASGGAMPASERTLSS